MKKIYPLLVIAAIALLNIAHAQTVWVDYKIDSKLSIKLPVAPVIGPDGSAISKTVDTAVYIITKVDFQKAAGIDSATLASLLPQQEFADGIKTGMLDKLPGFTMGNVKIGKWKNYYSYSMDGGNEARKLKIYNCMIIIGDEAYSITAVLPERLGAKQKDDVFASIRTN